MARADRVVARGARVLRSAAPGRRDAAATWRRHSIRRRALDRGPRAHQDLRDDRADAARRGGRLARGGLRSPARRIRADRRCADRGRCPRRSAVRRRRAIARRAARGAAPARAARVAAVPRGYHATSCMRRRLREGRRVGDGRTRQTPRCRSRRSPRCASDADQPSSTTPPFSMTSARSVCASTVPVVAVDDQRRDAGVRGSRRRSRQISRTISGARPSVASSRISSSGWSSARGRSRASAARRPRAAGRRCRRRSARRGNVVEHALEGPVRCAASRAGARRITRFSRTAQVREDAAAFGHVGDAHPRHRSGAGRVHVAAGRADAARASRTWPSSVRISVVLPMPLRPSRPSGLAGVDRQRHAAQHWLSP